MRYKSEFKVPLAISHFYADVLKMSSVFSLGDELTKSIGFEKRVDGEDERYSIEIDAFSTKDWQEFKKEIGNHIKNTFPEGRADYELVQFGSMFKRLEEIGLNKQDENSKSLKPNT